MNDDILCPLCGKFRTICDCTTAKPTTSYIRPDITDSFVIGIDLSRDSHESCVSVLRLCKGRYILVNNFYGEEAEELYDYLNGKASCL